MQVFKKLKVEQKCDPLEIFPKEIFNLILSFSIDTVRQLCYLRLVSKPWKIFLSENLKRIPLQKFQFQFLELFPNLTTLPPVHDFFNSHLTGKWKSALLNLNFDITTDNCFRGLALLFANIGQLSLRVTWGSLLQVG
jgi:hypothetical protein